MKNEKGFTLAEILGVIVILGLLVLLLAPGLINRIRSNSKQAEKTGNEIIYTAANQHINNNKNVYPSGRSYCISISTLISEGRLVRPVINVITGENIENKTVLAKIYRTDLIDFSIKDSDKCEAEKEKPIRTATITFAKGSNTSAIGVPTTKTCIIKEETNNCTVTAPTITPNEGYSASNWSKTNGATTGIAPGGNITITKNITYYGNSIDNIKPTVALSPNTQSDYIRGGKEVIVTVSDKGSKIPAKSTLSYAWSTSSTKSPTKWTNVTTTNTEPKDSVTANIPATATSSLTGSYYLWIRSGIQDIAGNTSNRVTSSVFNFDNTAPTISSITQNKTGWTNDSVVATLTGNDAHSGIADWKYIDSPQVSGQARVQSVGWLNRGVSSEFGTTGIGKNLTAFKLSITNTAITGGIKYAINNSEYVQDGAQAGTASSTITQIKMELTGNIATYYDIQYQVHRANIGWESKWYKNGENTSENTSNNIQSLRVKITEKSKITDENVWSSSGKNESTYERTYSNEQNTTNYIKLCDVSGNCSVVKEVAIKIDKTKPFAVNTGFYYNTGTLKCNNCNFKKSPETGELTCETNMDAFESGFLFDYYQSCFDNLSGCSKTEQKYVHDSSVTDCLITEWTDSTKMCWKAAEGNKYVGTYRDIPRRDTDNAGNMSGVLKTHLTWNSKKTKCN